MSGNGHNKLKANSCIYVHPNGGASIGGTDFSKAQFSSLGSGYNPNQAHGRENINIGGAGETAASASHDEVTAKNGIVEHLKQDWAHTKGAVGEVSDILTGKRAAADAAMGTAEAGADSIAALKKTGGEYLHKMGHGSKTLGAAKIGGYMVGASILADMLNPFDDD